MRRFMICTAHTHTIVRVIDKIEKNEMSGACSACGGEERRVQGLVGKPEGKRLLGRPKRRWEDNIKMDLQEAGCRDKD
jgi:hypothetical protein